MAYRQAMPRLLKAVGWEVLSEEFSEIEDPDPDQQRERQRELIEEFEQAKKKMAKGGRKKGMFSWMKPKPKKKDWWEMYEDDGPTGEPQNYSNDDPSSSSSRAGNDNVKRSTDTTTKSIDESIDSTLVDEKSRDDLLFDVDAIRNEISKAVPSAVLPVATTQFPSQSQSPVHSPPSPSSSQSSQSLSISGSSESFPVSESIRSELEVHRVSAAEIANHTYSDFEEENVWEDSGPVRMEFE